MSHDQSGAPCPGSGERWEDVSGVARCPGCGRRATLMVDRAPRWSEIMGGFLGHVPTHSTTAATIAPRATLPEVGIRDVISDL